MEPSQLCPGAGTLTWVALPLVVAGVIAIFRMSDATGRVIGIAGVTILILYPIPDLITTTELNPPYMYSVFATLIFVPLLAGLGIHWLSGLYSGSACRALVAVGIAGRAAGDHPRRGCSLLYRPVRAVSDGLDRVLRVAIRPGSGD